MCSSDLIFPKRAGLEPGSGSTIALVSPRGTASRKAFGIAFVWDIVSTPISRGRIASATSHSQLRRRVAVLILQGLTSNPRHLCTMPNMRASLSGPPSSTIQLRPIAGRFLHAPAKKSATGPPPAAFRPIVGPHASPYWARDADHLSKYALLNPDNGNPMGNRDLPYLENSRYFLISLRSSALVSCRSSFTK